MPKKDKEKTLSKKAKERLAKAEEEKKQNAVAEGDTRGEFTSAVLSQAVITGNLASRPDSRDLKISEFSVTTFGKQLVFFYLKFYFLTIYLPICFINFVLRRQFYSVFAAKTLPISITSTRQKSLSRSTP